MKTYTLAGIILIVIESSRSPIRHHLHDREKVVDLGPFR